MKKFLVAIAFGFMAIAAQAEATFDQVQTLIEQKNYAAAEQGLEVIIKNHPNSAKAFYAMAQAQAGLGNQEKAQKALNIATGLNPTLDFAPQSSVASLKEAITPQVAKIEAIEEGHFWRNFLLIALLISLIAYFGIRYKEKKDHEKNKRDLAEAETRAAQALEAQRQRMAHATKEASERQTLLQAHPNYTNERFDPTNPDVLLPKKTKAQIKQAAEEAARVEAEAEAQRQRLRAEAAEDDARRARSYQSSSPTVVNNNSSGNDMLTGVLIGNMLSGSHHDHTTVVEREVIREVPASSRDSSWDNDSSSSSSPRSSSWDSDSRSSSSSSPSSSSWDSGSSSNDSSSSSSSWD